MSCQLATRVNCYDGAGVDFLARIYGHGGAAITQATISGITWKVFDPNSATPTTPIVSGTLTVSAVVFNTLQNDSQWTVDAIGYNFLHQQAATAFPLYGKSYQLEYIFTPVSGAVFPLVYIVNTQRLYTNG